MGAEVATVLGDEPLCHGEPDAEPAAVAIGRDTRWVKRSKTRGSMSAEIPTPVSSIVTSTLSSWLMDDN